MIVLAQILKVIYKNTLPIVLSTERWSIFLVKKIHIHFTDDISALLMSKLPSISPTKLKVLFFKNESIPRIDECSTKSPLVFNS